MRSKNTSSTLEKSAFAMADLLIAIALLSAFLGGMIGLLRHTDAFLLSETSEKVKRFHTTNSQEKNCEGFITADVGIQVNKIKDNEIVKGRVGVSQWLIEGIDMNEDRQASSGYTLPQKGIDIIRPKIKLQAPSFNTRGTIKASELPIENFIIFKDNPTGTYYRYTFNGQDPTQEDLIWNHFEINFGNIPKIFKIRAFNDDHTASDVASLHFNIQWEPVFTREAGGGSEYVNLQELQQNSNKIVLGTGATSNDQDISYGFEPDAYEHKYEGPFHIPFKKWSKSGSKIYVKISPKSSHYGEPFKAEFQFKIKKTKLIPPVINSPKGRTLHRGDSIKIGHNDDKTNIITTVNNKKFINERHIVIDEY